MATKEIRVRWLRDMEFEAEDQRGHTGLLGQETGFKPSELLLVALAGCTAMDVVSILQKKRQVITGVEVVVRGEQLDDYPKRFHRAELEYLVHGKDVDPRAVERAIELSATKYCSVQVTLAPCVELHHSYRIVGEDQATS